MATAMKKNAIGYYLIAIAVVFGFMAFTLMPAQAGDEIKEYEAPIMKTPTYEADDTDLQGPKWKEAVNPVKIGDSLEMTFVDLPKGNLEFIRFSEPLDKDKYGRVNPPKHEVESKLFKNDNPSGEEETFTYKVPCWALTSKDKDDNLNIKVNLFFKDGSTGTSSAELLVVDSKVKCKGTEEEPKANPNFDASMRDGVKPDTGDGNGDEKPDPQPAEDTVVKASPTKVAQKGKMNFAVSKLPKDPKTTITLTLFSKNKKNEGNQLLDIVTDKPVKDDTKATVNWTVPCTVAVGKYAVTVDVTVDGKAYPSADSNQFEVTAGNCKKPKPNKPQPPSGSEDSDDTPPQDDNNGSQGGNTGSGGNNTGAGKDQEPSVTLTLHDNAGKEIVSLPRNSKLTIKTSYSGKADTVTFSLNSKPLTLGTAVVKKGKAQIETAIPCTFPLGNHTIEAKFEGKEPLIAKKAVTVTNGNCGVQPPLLNSGTNNGTLPPPLVNTASSTMTGPTLAKTGTASMVLTLLAIMFAGTGMYLVISRKENA